MPSEFRLDPGAVDAACFDLDGTLVDLRFRDPDMADVRADLAALFAEHGVEREFRPLLGTLEAALDDIAATTSLGTVAEVREAAYDRIAEADVYAARHQAVKGAAGPLLRTLRDRGTAVAVVTNNSRRGAEVSLGSAGFTADALVTRTDVERAKPAPDMVVAALDALDRDVAWFVMVGDRPSDAEAAVAAADARGVDVTTVLVGDDDGIPDPADVRVGSLSDLIVGGGS